MPRLDKKKNPVVIRKPHSTGKPRVNNYMVAPPVGVVYGSVTEIPQMVGGFTYGNAPVAVLPSPTPIATDAPLVKPVGSPVVIPISLPVDNTPMLVPDTQITPDAQPTATATPTTISAASGINWLWVVIILAIIIAAYFYFKKK